jgi:dienelactone hydrolase
MAMMRFALAISLICSVASAAVNWDSATTGGTIEGVVLEPKPSASPLPAVVYLQNLSIPRYATESDDAILKDLTESGHLVLVLDYARHPKAISPGLNADVLKLRKDIADTKGKRLLTDFRVDVNRLFILPEGFRLRRDVEFARDDDRVLAMDIMYPSKSVKTVPLLMEITCDNQNRMGSGSLLYCHDTLLEGAMAAGFAVAMVDHPVAPPYKGIDDPMPASFDRMKAAVAKLRELAPELGLNGKLGAIGFSRGGPFAAMLAATRTVDAAMIHGNRYDYLNLRTDDPMLARFEKAWGPRDSNKEKWAIHGAAYFLTKDPAPMFLNTSDTESPEYRDGLADFSRRLKELGIKHAYQLDRDARGHRVSTDPQTLRAAYDFFAKHLRASP